MNSSATIITITAAIPAFLRKKNTLVCFPFFNESTNARLFASTEKCKGTLSKCSPGILLVVLQIARNLWRSLKSEV